MCLGFPLKIVEINNENKVAQGEMNGVRRKVRIDFIPDIKLGEYVLVHAGFAMEKMDEKSVIETIESFNEIEEIIKADRN
ncbi:MAG TPA: HypC/HybG/HupF family hydrogenase formation chaperone [Clostridiaceae bacterium]